MYIYLEIILIYSDELKIILFPATNAIVFFLLRPSGLFCWIVTHAQINYQSAKSWFMVVHVMINKYSELLLK